MFGVDDGAFCRSRKKRSVDDLRKFDDGDSTTSNSSVEGESVMHLDGQSSSFLFGGNSTAVCLTRELSNLPMPTRERVSQDMYGLSDDDQDKITPQSLDLFETEIQKIEEKTAYDLAEKMSPDYVRNQRFRLMFLRACQGDSRKSAKRITRHFATKLKLFGVEKLVKDIEVSDLDEFDMEALRSGGFQVLPQRDLAGRSVLFGRYTAMRYREINNMVSFPLVSKEDVFSVFSDI